MLLVRPNTLTRLLSNKTVLLPARSLSSQMTKEELAAGIEKAQKLKQYHLDQATCTFL